MVVLSWSIVPFFLIDLLSDQVVLDLFTTSMIVPEATKGVFFKRWYHVHMPMQYGLSIPDCISIVCYQGVDLGVVQAVGGLPTRPIQKINNSTFLIPPTAR